ncbi:hypothetical protein HZA98_01230, partial [Candidatus Woesearchaeota archaeon]|nr:hypothetical protein [Candidatus Woesearchaeota archaeon]
YFYKHYKAYEKEAYLIEEMSYFRNRLDYYGEAIPFSFYQQHKKEFEEVIDILLEIVKV